MIIELHNIKPKYMSEAEVSASDIYLKPSVVFEQGKKYLVCAKSGRGKSSLLNFIYGSNLAYTGEITYGEPVATPFDLRLRKISYLFQDLCLFPELTALENVQIKNRLTGHKSDKEIMDMLDSVLEPEKKYQLLRTLSLGQRQRVAAVRALCQPFEFILMDEPFSHLDRTTSEAVAQMILREVEAQHAGMIMTALETTDIFPFDTIINL